MKLTKSQLNELLNQHIGTGYIILKTADNNVHIADVSINRKGDWCIGLDARPLAQGLGDIAPELNPAPRFDDVFYEGANSMR